jgi:hypothetical protein
MFIISGIPVNAETINQGYSVNLAEKYEVETT